MSSLQVRRPSVIHRVCLGKSYEGRDIELVAISSAPIEEERPEILLMAGAHPREQQPTTCLINLMDELVEGYGRDDRITRLVDSRRIWILPTLNVDGKVYDMQNGNGIAALTFCEVPMSNGP